jgi:60 kDa SS-A/Ro ribonucleoprotein
MKPKTKATKIEQLFAPGAYDNAPATNYEGAPTFLRSDEESLARVLTTGMLEPTFYASAQELAGETLALFASFAEKDPRYLAQAILYARNEGLMRLAPLTALVALSAAPNEDAKEMFRLVFPRVVRTPGDLQDIISLCRAKKIRGMGKVVQRAAGRWLAAMSEYHAIKYGAESQAMSLRDIYRLTRPKLTGRPNDIARYLVKGEVVDGLTQIAGYEAFKAAAKAYRGTPTLDGEKQLLALIAEHRLPWEVVSSQVSGSKAVWKAMLYQMPYMALLRNLNNMLKYEVTHENEALGYITRTLADPKRVAASKQFPFRFISALKVIEKSDGKGVEKIKEALETALELSFANMPELGDRVLIANDISGSMASRPSPKSDMTMAEIAGVFAAAAFKKAAKGEIVSFDTAAHPRAINQGQSLAQIAKVVSAWGGGTSLSAPLEYAFGGKGKARHYDVAIFITDSESWVDHLTRNRGALDLIREYRKRVNPGLLVFFMQLMPYKHAVVPPDEPGCYYLYGWDSAVMGFIAQMARGGASQIEAIRAISLLPSASADSVAE